MQATLQKLQERLQIKVRIIADSYEEFRSARLTTFELQYPSFIHPELLTHRVFSRNSESARAVSIDKRIEELENGFLPIFTSEQKGMVSEKCILDDNLEYELKTHWEGSREDSITTAWNFHYLEVHKQHCNRILEPYCLKRTILSGTDFCNFFDLRLHNDAQPEMWILAKLMYDEYMKQEKIQTLHEGEWHMPYTPENTKPSYDEIKICIARCARVSYNTHNKEFSDEAQIKLFDRLLENKHLSPFEHIAQVDYRQPSYSNFEMPFRQYRDMACSSVYPVSRDLERIGERELPKWFQSI